MGKVDILREVTAQDCRDYLKERSREPLRNKYGYGDEDRWSPPSVSTLNREIGFQRRFFRFCLQQGWIDRNPWDGVPSIRDKTNGKPRYNFTETDLKRIFSIAGKFADLYYFMLHTGVRPTDAFTVRSRAFKGHSMTLQMNKTGDWLRSIPVADHVIKRISNRIAMRGLLFPELKSDRQRRNARKLVQSLFTPNFVREKIITLHTFRHTYAQNMLNKGMPKEVLQTFLGHRSIRTTEIYANWLPSGELEKWIK